jgi:Ca2+-binding EF-hand superfamily protein
MEAYVPCAQINTVVVEGEELTVDNKKAKETILKLRKKLDEFNLDLHLLYSVYDKNNDQSLSADEFKHMLHRIDKNLTDDECGTCFKIFDINGDMKISYDEFFRTICKIAGQPYSKY